MNKNLVALCMTGFLFSVAPSMASADSGLPSLHAIQQKISERHAAHMRFLHSRHAAHMRFINERHRAHLRFLHHRHAVHKRVLHLPA